MSAAVSRKGIPCFFARYRAYMRSVARFFSTQEGHGCLPVAFRAAQELHARIWWVYGALGAAYAFPQDRNDLPVALEGLFRYRARMGIGVGDTFVDHDTEKLQATGREPGETVVGGR